MRVGGYMCGLRETFNGRSNPGVISSLPWTVIRKNIHKKSKHTHTHTATLSHIHTNTSIYLPTSVNRCVAEAMSIRLQIDEGV